ncbi:solute carrier family 22 member [Lynx pardinus]|uniref:Solute carrier family 22 member n=1 Tax=Lynx pardinus TaxID=191816 RepID=A0A485NWS8_LYNPA|nr:solute carrier family 22 member [Lynx pardinus]
MGDGVSRVWEVVAAVPEWRPFLEQMSGESNCKVKHRSHHPSKNLNEREAQEHSNSWSLEMLLRRLRATEANQDDKFAHVLDAVGEFGTFQRRLVVLTFIPNILLAFFISADVFVFTAQKPYCNTSWILAVGPNLTEAEQMNLTLPREPNGSFQTCLMYLPVAWDLDSIIQFGLNHTESCQDGWIYPDAKKRSLVNEFDLVCGKEQNSESMQTMFAAGVLTGSLIFGLMSDKLGRYPTILMSLLGLIIFGFGTAFVNTFHQYLFFRFGVSQALVGYTISSVSLATEWLVAEHRSHAIILEHCFFSVGLVFLTGLANSLPHWRLLFLVGGAPVFPLIFYICLNPHQRRPSKRCQRSREIRRRSVERQELRTRAWSRLKARKEMVLHGLTLKHFFEMSLLRWMRVVNDYVTTKRSVGKSKSAISAPLSPPVPSPDAMTLDSQLFLLVAASLVLHSVNRWLIEWGPFFFRPALSAVPSLTRDIILGRFHLFTPASGPRRPPRRALTSPSRATGLGLVSLAWAAGAISSLMIISQRLTLLPILALFFCSLLPETQDQPLPDILGHYPLQTRNMAEELLAKEVAPEGGTGDAVRNTVLDSTMLKLDSDVLSHTPVPGRAGDTDPRND